MAEPSVAAGVARGLMRFAVSKGADQTFLAERSQINAADLADQDNRIPFAKYVALMRAAKESSHDDALALHYGEAANIAEHSIVGLIGQACETIMEAFVQLNRYVRLVVDVDVGTAERFQLRHERGGLWFIDTRKEPNDFPELTESSFTQLVCGARSFRDIPKTPFVRAVHFTHSAPSYRGEYERIFQAPVTFDSDRNAMSVDETWLTHRIAILPRYAFGVLSEHADALLKSLERSTSTKGRVESLLMPILHTGNPDMGAIAAKLGVSRRTLSRKLKMEGTSFVTLLDELRHQLALHYLSCKRASVNETAYLLGFSDPTGFSRAFKRWTGSSPRSMR